MIQPHLSYVNDINDFNFSCSEVSFLRDSIEPLVIKEKVFELREESHRETIKFSFPSILVDDKIIASIYPKGPRNCHGVFFDTVELWLEKDAQELALVTGAKIVNFDHLVGSAIS